MIPFMKINQEQKLFVIPAGKGYTCLGFDVCRKRTEALAKEYNRPDLIGAEVGTAKAYENYTTLVGIARETFERTGKRSASELTPQLIGLERKRVEVVNCWGEKERFIVGKSTGFIPVHLQIKRRDSTGGMAVIGSPFKSIRILN